MAPYGAQLTALSKVPPGVFAYLQAHGAAVTKAAAVTASLACAADRPAWRPGAPWCRCSL